LILLGLLVVVLLALTLLHLKLLKVQMLLQLLHSLQFIILLVVLPLRVQLLLKRANRFQELLPLRSEQTQLFTSVSQVQELKQRFHLLPHTTHDIGMDHNGRNNPQRIKPQTRNNFRNSHGALRRNGRANGRFRDSARGITGWGLKD
jgi:hypothetical protein